MMSQKKIQTEDRRTRNRETKNQKGMGQERVLFIHCISQQKDNMKKSKLTVDFDTGF